MRFNIAAAIDPTYHRRAHEFQQDETEAKVPVTMATSLPVRGILNMCLAGAWYMIKPLRIFPSPVE